MENSFIDEIQNAFQKGIDPFQEAITSFQNRIAIQPSKTNEREHLD